jgi:hypothetical protein
VNTLLADPPAVADPEQPSSKAPDASSPPGVSPEAPESTDAAAGPTCAKCGAPMEPGQDWCLQCGAGAPGSLDAGGPSWRSAAAILTATTVLVLGAAAAAYAALNKEGAAKPHPTIVAVAAPSTTAAATPTPTTPVTPTPTTPEAATPTPKASGAPAINPLAPTGSANPPKIPLTAPTPKSTGTSTTPAKTKETSPTTTTPSSGNESGGGTATEQASAALVLDPDAASTYNPYGYPAGEFGDPSLAIDGDTSTAWTAQVNPAVAPKMAEGLAIDLKSAQRISAVELITSTPGMSVQIYGANSQTLPTSITDPAWVQLSPYLITKKRNERIKLKDSSKGFRFITLWISKAPAGSAGTPQDRVPPTDVAVNELELFAAK